MSERDEKPVSLNIFQLLSEAAEEKKKEKRQELLEPSGVKEFFTDGNIVINKRICQGIECNLCVEKCPTNALFWRAGEIGVTEELCVYCSACVFTCIVDNCIKIVRRRPTGEAETFSKPGEVLQLQSCINARKRLERIRGVYPEIEDYLKRHKPLP